MPVGAHPSPSRAPTFSQPEPMLWPNGPCGSYYDCRTHLSNNRQGTLKRQVCSSPHLGPHSKVGEREHSDQGFCLYWGQRKMPGDCMGSVFTTDFKQKRRNYSTGREKQGFHWFIMLGTQAFLKGELHGGDSLALYLLEWVAGEVFVQDRCF